MTITTTTTTSTIISTNHDFLFQYCNLYSWYSRLLLTWRHCSVRLPAPSPPPHTSTSPLQHDYSLTYTFFDILPWFLISIKHFWSIDYTSEMFLLLCAVIDILYKTSVCAVNFLCFMFISAAVRGCQRWWCEFLVAEFFFYNWMPMLGD